MKIGFDLRALLGNFWFGPKTGSSFAPAGVAGYVFNVLKNLTDIDQENEYILFFNSFKTPDTGIIQSILDKPNVTLKTFHLPNKIFDRTARFLQWPKLDSLLGDIDVYFSPHFNITPLSDKTRHVIVIHDLSFEIYPEFFPWRKRFWHWSQDVKNSCQNADRIIAVSENTKQDLINLYNINSDKIEVVYSGVSLNHRNQKNTENTKTIFEKYNLSENYILYLGTLEPRKNVESMIEAFEVLLDSHPEFISGSKETLKPVQGDSGVSLVLAGGKGWLYRKILKQVEKSKYKDNIHLLGYVSEEDKAALIQNAQIFLFPSYYEGFGFPPLEALSLGTPVITSLNSSLSEVVKESALLVDPYNINDLSQAMCELLGNESLKKATEEKGRNLVKKYSWDTTASETLRVLTSR